MTDQNVDMFAPDVSPILSNYLGQYLREDNLMDNPLTIHNIKSSYYDLDKLNIDDESNEEYEYTCVHINIQSLPAKFEKLKYLISEFQEQNIDIDFILLCETFLTDNIAQQFNIPGYNLLSRNRNTKRGGVAIFINNKHNYQSREDLEIFVSGEFESIFVEIQEKDGNRGTIVGEIYRVPNTSEITSINRYENITKKLSDMPQNVIIGTDQNFDYLKVNSHKNTQDLLCTFLNNGLVPTITLPTRIATTGNTNKTVRTLIDNIYISSKHNPILKSGIYLIC